MSSCKTVIFSFHLGSISLRTRVRNAPSFENIQCYYVLVQNCNLLSCFRPFLRLSASVCLYVFMAIGKRSVIFMFLGRSYSHLDGESSSAVVSTSLPYSKYSTHINLSPKFLEMSPQVIFPYPLPFGGLNFSKMINCFLVYALIMSYWPFATLNYSVTSNLWQPHWFLENFKTV